MAQTCAGGEPEFIAGNLCDGISHIHYAACKLN
jgi:hypothetical protein